MNIKKENLRIKNISKAYINKNGKLNFKEIDNKYGLNIEYKCGDDSWIVIATIKPEDSEINIIECGKRVINYINEDNFSIYRDLCKIAYDIVSFEIEDNSWDGVY